mgnify:CR=1 FL=1
MLVVYVIACGAFLGSSYACYQFGKSVGIVTGKALYLKVMITEITSRANEGYELAWIGSSKGRLVVDPYSGKTENIDAILARVQRSPVDPSSRSEDKGLN